MIARALVISILLLSSSLAHADWQYAKWGMSSQQLMAASKGEAKPVRPGVVCAFDDQKPLAMIPMKRIDQWSFEVVFCGVGGKLRSVALEAKPGDGSYNSLRAALLSRYGRPIQDGAGDIAVSAWNDAKGGNLVRLIKVLTAGRIEYRAAASGL